MGFFLLFMVEGKMRLDVRRGCNVHWVGVEGFWRPGLGDVLDLDMRNG